MENPQQMTSRRPYLIRAFYDWITDNAMTPLIAVDAGFEGVEVPRECVVDGEIVLNLSPSAVRNLDIGSECITFDARFSGRAQSVLVPVEAVYAIYAQENGEGGVFSPPRRHDGAEPDDADRTPEPASGRPALKIVR